MIRRIALVAGYTAGHINAAIAVAEGYKKTHPGYDITFIGARDGLEAAMIARLGMSFHGISAAPVMGRGIGRKLHGGLALVRGIYEAHRLLRTLAPDLVVGFGGYATAGVLLAAASLRVPTLIHEANAVAGRANRLLGRVVDRVLVATGEARTAFPGHHVSIVGMPVRTAVLTLHRQDRTPPDPTTDPVHFLVMGGSLGSAEVNLEMPQLASALHAAGLRFDICHQAGARDLEPLRNAYHACGIVADVVPYIEDMHLAYARAHFVISAAGANTLAELALAGIPALLVPLRSAVDDHQTQNARVFARESPLRIVTESPWDVPALSRHVLGVVSDPAAWARAAAAVRARAMPDAVERFVDACETLCDELPRRRRR